MLADRPSCLQAPEPEGESGEGRQCGAGEELGAEPDSLHPAGSRCQCGGEPQCQLHLGGGDCANCVDPGGPHRDGPGPPGAGPAPGPRGT